ncbi:type IV pilus modification protein PilV [Agaribacterium haliotis]|uniref:type IV pilus modification protein PilV n=1 Tax=Agaribacterium haliotis TaxID=2013869 RepID=UPI000BB5516D|nr:type IV pilus modification protein PilV [Agaribacterium haliotis]
MLVSTNCTCCSSSASRLPCQAGATMIETLVAFFLLAFALLGVLSMQVQSVKSVQRAYFSSIAPLLAADMVERIYAHNNVDDINDNASFNGVSTHSASAAPDCRGGCDKTAQKNLIVAEWARQIKTQLPMGLGVVKYGADIYTVTVMWDSEGLQPSGKACGPDPAVDLACYSLELKL